MIPIWESPKRFLRGKRLKIGQILDPEQLGMQPHPLYGPLPVLVVLETFDDCSLMRGQIRCATCGHHRIIVAGDWFQVRRCVPCQKKHAATHPESRAKPELEKARTKKQIRADRSQKNSKKEAIRQQALAERKARDKREEDARSKMVEEERQRLERERRRSKYKFKVISGGPGDQAETEAPDEEGH